MIALGVSVDGDERTLVRLSGEGVRSGELLPPAPPFPVVEVGDMFGTDDGDGEPRKLN